MTDTSKLGATPSADELFAAFFAGNDVLVNPYIARPSELVNGLRNVWITARKDYCLSLERQRDELAEALRKLSNEINGLLNLGEPALRRAVGNTNMSVLKLRLNESASVLAKIEGEQK